MLRTKLYTDGGYLLNNPGWNEEDAVHKVAWLNGLLSKNPLSFDSVTDIGCGTGRVLKELSALLPPGISYQGFDISPQAIEYAQNFSSDNMQFICADYIQATTPKTDLVIMFDVLEHVPDYYGFLDRLKQKGNLFAFHIPLDLCCRSLLKPHVLLQQRNNVGHIHYFSREMVLWMLKDTGYEIIDWNYTLPVTDFSKPRSLKQSIKKALRNTSFSIHKNLSADLWGDYSMMILAR